MPILELQRRLREVGRIRIGEKVETTNRQGKKIQRPRKLDTFRLTSRDERVIRVAAELWGGAAEAWEDTPDGSPQWQVLTTTASIDVVIPPGETSFSQWLELWSGGGCQRRCDGRWEVIGDQACVCDPIERECSYHTRLSVMLRDLPGLGVWRLDTQGFYAATELAGAVDVCQAATERGQMLPARLRLEQRQVKRPGQQTKRFAVPVLDVDVTMGALTSGRVPTMGELADPVTDDEARGLTPVDREALPPGPQPSVAEQAASVGEPPARKTRKNAAQPVPRSGLRPRTAAEAAAAERTPAPIVPAPEVVETFQAKPTAVKLSQKLVIRCREVGITTDDARHAFVGLATDGRTTSTKEVHSAEADWVLELCNRIERRELELTNRAGEWELVDIADDEPVEAELVATTTPAPAPGTDSGQPGTADEWKQALKAAGLRMTQALKEAQRVANELNRDGPGTLAQLAEDPEIAGLVWIWVADRSGS